MDVDRVLLKSRAQIKIDPRLLIQQPTFNDVAKVHSSVAHICLVLMLIFTARCYASVILCGMALCLYV